MWQKMPYLEKVRLHCSILSMRTLAGGKSCTGTGQASGRAGEQRASGRAGEWASGRVGTGVESVTENAKFAEESLALLYNLHIPQTVVTLRDFYGKCKGRVRLGYARCAGGFVCAGMRF